MIWNGLVALMVGVAGFEPTTPCPPDIDARRHCACDINHLACLASIALGFISELSEAFERVCDLVVEHMGVAGRGL